MFVVDASVALAWCFEDERTALADRVLDRLDEEDAIAPAIWPLEVANAFRTAERRGRLSAADRTRLGQLLRDLPISVEPTDLEEALGPISAVARTYDLSAYDASYLALAARQGIELATMDERLTAACGAAGVRVIR